MHENAISTCIYALALFRQFNSPKCLADRGCLVASASVMLRDQMEETRFGGPEAVSVEAFHFMPVLAEAVGGFAVLLAEPQDEM